jgi:tetraacyldisaccharide 4'-kinase
MRINPAEFRDLVSGRKRGLLPALKRLALRIAEVPYTLGVAMRNRQFNTGYRKKTMVGVPVISVGNLTVGGTGKTPMVEWLAKYFRSRKLRVAIISRGYGAEEGAVNDEALELEQKLPDVPHLQNPNRVEAAQIAIEELETEFIILDDGFQHRQIYRDVDIVLLDALEPFGYEHLLPRGTLREPISGLQRADVVVLTRAEMLSPDERAKIRERVERFRPDVVWVEASHAPQSLLNSAGEQVSLESLRGQRIAAFCGIGNPAGFRHTLTASGFELVELREFPDHHLFSRDDVSSLSTWADQLDISAVLCTCKDLVKLRVPRIGKRPLWAVSVEMEILNGKEAMESRLEVLAKQVHHGDTEARRGKEEE